jgi:N-acetylglutamate synthase-like GNAT family acetyltransferase
MSLKIRRATIEDRPWVLEIVQGWGADFVVTRGRKAYPADVDAFIACDEHGERIGLATYEIIGGQCEVVTLDALTKFQGVGSALMNAVIDDARARGCIRIWLITTNDNLDAIRFYQRRGFVISAVHCDAIAESRKMKPSIAEIGNYGIPIRDEIEFEMALQ